VKKEKPPYKIVDEKCFICNKSLKREISSSDPNTIWPVYDGISFRATGNYGSTVFDPITDDGFLEILICDECIKKKSKQIKRVRNIQTKTEYKYETGTFKELGQ